MNSALQLSMTDVNECFMIMQTTGALRCLPNNFLCSLEVLT